MKINGFGFPAEVRSVKKSKRRSSSFSLEDDSGSVTMVDSNVEVRSADGVASLTNLQEICSDVDLCAHGFKLLNGLKGLQLKILSGDLDTSTLKSLERELSNVNNMDGGNLELRETLQELKQRVSVEIAKNDNLKDRGAL